MNKLLLGFALLWAVAGCKGDKAAKPSAGAAPVAPATSAGEPANGHEPGGSASAQGKAPASAARPADDRRAARHKRQLDIAERARAALKAWEDAQNRGDRDSYLALYHPRHFKGVRRTHNGKVNPFDFKGWSKDRSKMFKLKNMHVAAENVEIATWLDEGSKGEHKLDKGVVAARFIQRWRGGKYADHGVKVIHFWLDKKDHLRIVYEDLLNSEPGWDRLPQAEVEQVAMAVPKSQEAAMQRWQELAITAANYPDKLASIPADTALARALAEALVRAGGFICKKTVDYGHCGIEELEFAPLGGTETFADPCVRRRLLPWALEELTPTQVLAVREQLLSMAALPEPATEVLGTVLSEAMEAIADEDMAYEELDEADEQGKRKSRERRRALQELVVALFVRVDHERVPGSVTSAIDDLSISVLIRLIREAKLEYAVVALADQLDQLEAAERKPAHAAVAEAIADESLSPVMRAETLEELDVPSFPERKVLRDALSRASHSSYCPLAGAAVSILLDMGENSFKPKRPTSDRPEDYARLLCLLFQVELDGDQTEELWSSLLPAKGKVEVVDVVEDLDYEMWQLAEADLDEDEDEEEGDEDEGDEDEDEEEGDDDGDGDPARQTSTDHIERATSSFEDLSMSFDEFGERVPSCSKVTSTSTGGETFACSTEVGKTGMVGRDDGDGLKVKMVELSGSDHVSVTFARAEGGKFYIIELARYTTTGCPC